MSDYISREAASVDECKHKIKTSFARIIVEETPEKPYYNIWYFDPADGECHIGFGSYFLDNVFNWLAEEFEVMEPRADVRLVRNGRWVRPHWRNSSYCCDCSECGGEAMHREYQWNKKGIYPICPNCGAKMCLEEDTCEM